MLCVLCSVVFIKALEFPQPSGEWGARAVNTPCKPDSCVVPVADATVLSPAHK